MQQCGKGSIRDESVNWFDATYFYSNMENDLHFLYVVIDNKSRINGTKQKPHLNLLNKFNTAVPYNQGHMCIGFAYLVRGLNRMKIVLIWTFLFPISSLLFTLRNLFYSFSFIRLIPNFFQYLQNGILSILNSVQTLGSWFSWNIAFAAKNTAAFVCLFCLVVSYCFAKKWSWLNLLKIDSRNPSCTCACACVCPLPSTLYMDWPRTSLCHRNYFDLWEAIKSKLNNPMCVFA